MIKLVVFDWDDVITRGSTEAYFKCYHQMLVEMEVSLSAEEEERRIKAKWGSIVEEEIAELLKETPNLVKKGVSIYENLLMGDTFVDCLSLIPGSDKVLEGLSNNYKLAIASGINPKLLKDKIFPKFKIKNIFSEILTVYDVDDPSHAKPHPYLLFEIMRKLNIEPGETVMVGDAKGDVEMAQKAGVTPIVVMTGHLTREEAESFGVKYIIEDVTKIEEILNILG